MNSRREAIFIITRWLATRRYPDRMIPDVAEHAFITDLVYTTVRRHRTLEWVLKRLLKKVPGGESGAALLVGACQLLYMPDVAEHAAIYETVEAAKITSRKTTGLINGVLRNLQRQRAAILDEIARAPLALRTSHPDPLVYRWLKRYGEATTTALCDWNNQPATTWLATAPNTPTPFDNTYLPHPSTPNFYQLPRGRRVEQAPGFADGTFIVQDPATAAALTLMDIHPGQRVLDACAAPGGKTIQLAWRMEQATNELVALELHADRLALLDANLKRTRQEWVKSHLYNLNNPQAPQELGRFDRILLDAPCSNTGVLQRRPDARWRWNLPRLKQLVKTQNQLLASALNLLALGGKIVYSTCSLEPEENQQQVAQICREHPELTCIEQLDILPTRTHSDGAFACVLQKS